MKRSKDDLLKLIREHGGDTPDDFIIGLLEDVADSFEDPSDELTQLRTEVEELNKNKTSNEDVTKQLTELQDKYAKLQKSYADRFTIKTEEKKEENKTETNTAEETEETFDSIFE